MHFVYSSTKLSNPLLNENPINYIYLIVYDFKGIIYLFLLELT
jgi:hypothetical protein